MVTVNEYFDHVFLITLKNSVYGPAKLKEANIELNKAGIKFEVYYGLDCTGGIPKDYPEKPVIGFLTNKPGAFGCLISHLGVIKIAKERGYKNILILEDDIALSKDFINLFSKKIKDLPKDWHLVYLGGSGHTGIIEEKVTTKITDHISKTWNTSTTSSYAIHERAYDHVLEKHKGPKGMPIDQYYRVYQQIHPSYIMRPNIAWQKPGFTDISNGCYRNYEGFMKEIE